MVLVTFSQLDTTNCKMTIYRYIQDDLGGKGGGS